MIKAKIKKPFLVISLPLFGSKHSTVKVFLDKLYRNICFRTIDFIEFNNKEIWSRYILYLVFYAIIIIECFWRIYYMEMENFLNICIAFNEETGKLYFYKDGLDLIMEMGFVADEFCFVIYTDKKIVLTKDNIDESFYSILESFMKNKYKFYGTKSSKTDTYFKWYSDCYWDIDADPNLSLVSYLEIESKDESIEIQAHNNGYLEKIGRCICFSPAGNGQYAVNEETGANLQDDFVENIYRKYKLIERENQIKLIKK